ncbi:glycosyltransferase family 4 protein [Salinibacterium soli]|uniref:Glycosyltransferase family 1 protein n=1 Tax=Antiquaquibacter soli TaxID=3064523 RepID=A0ABT9BJE5_9MICO|nr:glycosyltransferase family 1 protein [Protaetiibacter sp. WY-16]MDO7881135.1 glycosyltransferase family 1 protein [Protaetiibacter sp. WY-16]
MPLVLVDLLSYTGTKGGMETYTRELYRSIGDQPGEFTFVGLASREGFELDTSWFPGEVVPSGISGENRVQWALGELFAVGRWASRLGADLIHGPATLGPARTRIPVVLTMHDMLYFSHPEFMSTPLYTEPVKWMEKVASRNASWVVTDSETSASEIVKYLDYPRERLQVVLLAGASDPTRAEHHERRGDLILAMGNRRPHKNFDNLVRALALVDPAIRPTLTITGSRGDDPLRPLVAELSLQQWVDLRSWVSQEELEELYGTASALAVPSYAEGFGLPILEAMGAGLPVMISDLPVFREVAADSAVYFDPADPVSIAAAITRIVSEPGLREKLERVGAEQAALFSWSATAAQTLDAFRSALANPRR